MDVHVFADELFVLSEVEALVVLPLHAPVADERHLVQPSCVASKVNDVCAVLALHADCCCVNYSVYLVSNEFSTVEASPVWAPPRTASS